MGWDYYVTMFFGFETCEAEVNRLLCIEFDGEPYRRDDMVVEHGGGPADEPGNLYVKYFLKNETSETEIAMTPLGDTERENWISSCKDIGFKNAANARYHAILEVN